MCLPSAALYKRTQSQAKLSCECFRSAPRLVGWRYLCLQGLAAKNKRGNIWIPISFAFTPQRYLNLFSLDWGFVKHRVDNLKATHDACRPVNLQRNTVKRKDLRKQPYGSCHQVKSPLLQTRKKTSEVTLSLSASVTFISFRHLIFLQGKQLGCTSMKINVLKVVLPFTCSSCATGKWLIKNVWNTAVFRCFFHW